MDQERLDKLIELAKNITRSTVAVVDTIAGRGVFKGEELTPVGRLRDQCVQLSQLCEEYDSSKNAE